MYWGLGVDLVRMPLAHEPGQLAPLRLPERYSLRSVCVCVCMYVCVCVCMCVCVCVCVCLCVRDIEPDLWSPGL